MSSDVGEQVGRWFLEQRKLPIIQLFDHIWNKTMEAFVNRSKVANAHPDTLTAAANTFLNTTKDCSQLYTLFTGSFDDHELWAKVAPTEALWNRRENQRSVHLVFSAAGPHPIGNSPPGYAWCDYRQAVGYRLPCKHVIAVCKTVNGRARMCVIPSFLFLCLSD